MPGAIALAIALLVVFPIAIALSGAVMAAILGWDLTKTGEDLNEGSELIPLNR